MYQKKLLLVALPMVRTAFNMNNRLGLSAEQRCYKSFENDPIFPFQGFWQNFNKKADSLTAY